MTSPPDSSLIGCYALSGLPPSPFTYLFATASIQACSEACMQLDLAVFAYRGRKCACGTLLPNENEQLSSDQCSSPCPGDPAVAACPAARWNASSNTQDVVEAASVTDDAVLATTTLVWTVHYSNYTSPASPSNSTSASSIPALSTASAGVAGANSGGSASSLTTSSTKSKTWLIPVVVVGVVIFLALMGLLGWWLYRSRSHRRRLVDGVVFPADTEKRDRLGPSPPDSEEGQFGVGVAATEVRQVPLDRYATAATRSSSMYGDEKDLIQSWRASSIAPTARPSSHGHSLGGDDIIIAEVPAAASSDHHEELQSAESGVPPSASVKRRSRGGGSRRPPSTMTTRFSDLVPGGFLRTRTQSMDSTKEAPEGPNVSTDAICNHTPTTPTSAVHSVTVTHPNAYGTVAVGGSISAPTLEVPPPSPTSRVVRRLSRRPTSWLARRNSRPMSHDGPNAASPLPVRQVKTSFGVGDDDRPSMDVLDGREAGDYSGMSVARLSQVPVRTVQSDHGHHHPDSDFPVPGLTRTLSDYDHSRERTWTSLQPGAPHVASLQTEGPLTRSHSVGPTLGSHSPFAWRDSRYSEFAAHSREPSSLGHHTVVEMGPSRSGSVTSSGHWLLGSAPGSPVHHRSGVDVRREGGADDGLVEEASAGGVEGGSDAGLEDDGLSFSPSASAANRLRLATGDQPMHPVYPAQPLLQFAPPSDSNFDSSTPRLPTPAASGASLDDYGRRLDVVPWEGATSPGAVAESQGGEAPRAHEGATGFGFPMWRQRLNSVGSFATLLEDRHKLSLTNPDHSIHSQSVDSLPSPPGGPSPSPPRLSFDRGVKLSARQLRNVSGSAAGSIRSREVSASTTPTPGGELPLPLTRFTTAT